MGKVRANAASEHHISGENWRDGASKGGHQADYLRRPGWEYPHVCADDALRVTCAVFPPNETAEPATPQRQGRTMQPDGMECVGIRANVPPLMEANSLLAGMDAP